MQEVNPRETSRACAFELWMNAPMPMVTFFRTLHVGRLLRISKRKGLKFNMLMCYCIGRAASGIKEFYLLPVGRKLLRYDRIAVNTIVADRRGEVSSCDIPFTNDLAQFNRDYLRLTRRRAAPTTTFPSRWSSAPRRWPGTKSTAPWACTAGYSTIRF